MRTQNKRTRCHQDPLLSPPSFPTKRRRWQHQRPPAPPTASPSHIHLSPASKDTSVNQPSGSLTTSSSPPASDQQKQLASLQRESHSIVSCRLLKYELFSTTSRAAIRKMHLPSLLLFFDRSMKASTALTISSRSSNTIVARR